jgi:hypothetical protein
MPFFLVHVASPIRELPAFGAGGKIRVLVISLAGTTFVVSALLLLVAFIEQLLASGCWRA